MRLECGKDPQFQCDYCPYKAYQKIALQKHTFCKHQCVVKTKCLFHWLLYLYVYIFFSYINIKKNI